jgi:manganese/zinc/iron transport system permease protein
MKHMLILSAVFGMLAGGIGAFLSFLGNNLPTGPFMVIGASVIFVCAYFFAPKHGVVTRWVRHLKRRQRIGFENMLKAMHRVQEDRDFRGEGVSLKELANLRRETLEEVKHKISSMARQKIVTLGEDGNMAYFTPDSFKHASRIVRNHRLWELYLTNEANYSADHVHEDAEKIEHVLGEEIVRELERTLNYPETDPHGKRIPGARDLNEVGVSAPEAATGYGTGAT